MGYLNSISPYDLTINELAEVQSKPNAEKVLHHYRGELFNSTLHFCDLCDRPFKLRQFFKDYEMAKSSETGDGELQELQFRAECLLNITDTEWNHHYLSMEEEYPF